MRVTEPGWDQDCSEPLGLEAPGAQELAPQEPVKATDHTDLFWLRYKQTPLMRETLNQCLKEKRFFPNTVPTVYHLCHLLQYKCKILVNQSGCTA